MMMRRRLSGIEWGAVVHSIDTDTRRVVLHTFDRDFDDEGVRSSARTLIAGLLSSARLALA